MNDLQSAFDICYRQLVGRQVTDEMIINVVDQFAPIFKDVNKDDLKNLLLASFNVSIDITQTLVNRESYRPWLDDYKLNHRVWPFWDRYKLYLQVQKHFSPNVVNELDDMTDNVLDKLFNPSEQDGTICKKGLVVGQVQSGKTANYTGLICKAADAGFNMIIVLAGALEDLRCQTQTRLDEGFLGFDTQIVRAYNSGQNSRWIGVGLIDHKANGLVANSYTTSATKGDFKRSTATSTAAGFNFLSNDPMLLVIKKNSRILENLCAWLESNKQDLDTKKLLLIDDEADHYSINTKDKGERTAINRGIRNLLNLFAQKAYVGYTATPFANIFIDINDHEDLFPRDFIISLPIPTSYVGPERYFGVNEDLDADEDPKVIPAVTTINDYASYIPDNHKMGDQLPTDIPESMKTAIKQFILNCAIRRVRGQEKQHNSMLIHVSRYKNWHKGITELVDNEFRTYSNMIKADDPDFLEELRGLYETDDLSNSYKSYRSVTNYVKGMDIGKNDIGVFHASWENVKRELYPAVIKIKVKAINGDSKEELNYDGGQAVSVIAVGGDKLSRGLTLEGLTVSYFLRASKMYDTLMQMGRWFGYRPGYVDLCRLHLSSELNEWYRHVAIATKELRDEFKYLYETGGTPEHFALKVRIHPGALKITALGKMRNADDIRVSWAGHLSETYLMHKDSQTIESNLNAVDDLVNNMGDYTEIIKDNYLWRNIDHSMITNFLSKYTLPDSIVNLDLATMIEFIEGLAQKGEYTNWNVALMSLKSNPNSDYTFNSGIKVNLSLRNDSHNEPNYYALRKNHIISPSDELLDLDNADVDAKYDVANQRFKDRYKIDHPDVKDDKLPNLAKNKWVRTEYRSTKTPLLLLYPLSQKGIGNSDENKPIMGFAISFPNTTHDDSAVAYKVNYAAKFNALVAAADEFDDNNDNDYVEDND